MGGSKSSGSVFGMSNPKQGIPPLNLSQPPQGGQNILAQLEGRYVAPTGAGFRYHQGGPTGVPFNPLMLQQMLQQAQQAQQQAQQAQPQRVLPGQPGFAQYLASLPTPVGRR